MDYIKDGWYVILNSKEIKPNRALSIERFSKQLAVWRTRSGNLHCIDDRCSHRGASLGLGRVKDQCIECPFHGITFDGQGQCTGIPFHQQTEAMKARFNLNHYPLTERFGLIWMWLGPADQINGEPQWFEELTSEMAYSTVKKEWQTHYTRAIENQLDYAHLPFVHRKTIGRGFQPLDELHTQWDDDMLSVDLGERLGYFRFRFPNIWLLKTGGGTFVFVAFVPMSQERTRLYMRFYVPRYGNKWISQLVATVAGPFNMIILNEDKQVVLSQRPRAITPDMDEQLLRLDRPIAEFRRRYLAKLNGQTTSPQP